MEVDAGSVALERLGVKTVCAATALQNMVASCARLKKLEHKVHRYVYQVSLIVTWKRGSAAVKVLGSAAKTVGTVAMLAAPLHPKIRLFSKVGRRLWRLGAGLKILDTIACIIKDLWQSGCRNTLVEFTHSAAKMTRNLVTFQELITDLQSNVELTSNFASPTVDVLFQSMKQFIPQHLHRYAFHVISIVLGGETYSPLFDFVALTCDPQDESHVSRLMRELEAFHFAEFIQASDSKSLIAIGSFLHISREVLDFLDGFQRLTNKDCHFLHECLMKFVSESESIMKVISFLSLLDKVKTPNNHPGKREDVRPVLSLMSADPDPAIQSEENQESQNHVDESIIYTTEGTNCSIKPVPSGFTIKELSDNESGSVIPVLVLQEEDLTHGPHKSESVAPTILLQEEDFPGVDKSGSVVPVLLLQEGDTLDVDQSYPVTPALLSQEEETCGVDKSETVTPVLLLQENSPNGPDNNTENSMEISESHTSTNLLSKAYSSVSVFIKKGASVVGSVTTKVHKHKSSGVVEAESQFTDAQSNMNRI